MRILLFTGKGGVGKTTVAAATAVRAAEAGLRTIVCSTDPAHSLADAFEVAIGDVPNLIIDNLWAQQIDAQGRLEDNWREIQDYFIQLMNWAGTETIQAEELTVIPGLDEIFSLIDVKTHVESGLYDMLVIDWGEIGSLSVFCAVLAWSRWRFVCFADNQRADTTMAALAACFEALGGVPATVLSDRMGCLKGATIAGLVLNVEWAFVGVEQFEQVGDVSRVQRLDQIIFAGWTHEPAEQLAQPGGRPGQHDPDAVALARVRGWPYLMGAGR